MQNYVIFRNFTSIRSDKKEIKHKSEKNHVTTPDGQKTGTSSTNVENIIMSSIVKGHLTVNLLIFVITQI